MNKTDGIMSLVMPQKSSNSSKILNKEKKIFNIPNAVKQKRKKKKQPQNRTKQNPNSVIIFFNMFEVSASYQS